MTQQHDWQWCGFAHHFIGGHNCQYSLATWVAGGRWLVSTVGDYRPGRAVFAETLGSGDDSFYETMVFECDPNDRDAEGEPCTISWSEEACRRYGTAREATAGHLQLCHEWDAMAKHSRPAS